LSGKLTVPRGTSVADGWYRPPARADEVWSDSPRPFGSYRKKKHVEKVDFQFFSSREKNFRRPPIRFRMHTMQACRPDVAHAVRSVSVERPMRYIRSKFQLWRPLAAEPLTPAGLAAYRKCPHSIGVEQHRPRVDRPVRRRPRRFARREPNFF